MSFYIKLHYFTLFGTYMIYMRQQVVITLGVDNDHVPFLSLA